MERDTPNRVNDPQTARYLRKQYQKQGFDCDEENQEANFRSNPSDSIDKYAKRQTQKKLQKQIEYFGNAIEPFHMQNEQMMGQIDDDGFFVFNQRGKGKKKDAWLQSIGEGDQYAAADQITKKIKTESRFKTVYEANQTINKDLKQNQHQSDSQEGGQQQNDGNQEENNMENREETFSVEQLLQLMISLLPTPKINANNYMKKLKAQKNMEEYNRLLTISNEYIEKTSQYDILTKKRNQLQQMLSQMKAKNGDNEDDNEPLNWDQDSENEPKAEAKGTKKQLNEGQHEEDDIF